MDLPAEELGARLPLFEAIIPWFSLGVANVIRHRANHANPGAPSPEQLLALAKMRWNLTNREAQVLQLLMGGAANKDVAKTMGSSVKTVEFHVSNVLRKAGVTTRGMLLAVLLDQANSSSTEHQGASRANPTVPR